jgi:hypothetical protein
VQLLLGHTKLENTVRYLGVEVDDALEMAEQTDIKNLTGRVRSVAIVASRPRSAIRVAGHSLPSAE